MTGRSVLLDPLTHAVRRDIADVRLADRVFAPHYAVPMACTFASACTLRGGPESDSPGLAQVAAGDRFEVLDLSGTLAWGIAPLAGLVGYVDSSALADPKT